MNGDVSFRCGFAAIVGRPNVGKSTLMNRILGRKISITSRKPQTTRHRILGIKTTGAYQAVYLDTPGLNLGSNRAINRFMNREATGAMVGVDVVVFVIEALRWADGDADVQARLDESQVPVLLVVNKVDRVPDKTSLLPFIEQAARRREYAEIVPISARSGQNAALLEELVVRNLPEGAAIFPEDQITDRSERFLAAEVVREKLTRRLGKELPYRISVEVEHWEERERLLEVGAVVWVERSGQKAIVIGRQGRLLKTVGSEAREELESFFGKQVVLKLWAKVREGWSGDEALLRRMGYE